LDGVGLEVAGGTCLAVVGNNGSGKSTLLDVLSGLRRPDRGTVEIDGKRPPWHPGPFAAQGIRRTFQEPRLVPDLGVDDNIALGLSGQLPAVLTVPLSRRRRERGRVSAARGAVGLDIPAWWPAAKLSYGQRKRVELARVLVASPSVALLDEPLAGVAEDDRLVLLEGIAMLVADGAAVVLVEHDRAAVNSVATNVLELENGHPKGEHTEITK
jgi:ABC-type branched-subunit amino acid transport system ATPase component